MNAPPLSECKNWASKRKRINAAASLHGIERLSDDILIVILSYLSLKEANIYGIKNLNIVSPSLKSLIITGCDLLENLAIFAVNLVSFEYAAYYFKLDWFIEFGHVPVLSELTYSGNSFQQFLFGYRHHSKYINHLEKLVLHVHYGSISLSILHIDEPLRSGLRFQCLKQLDLVLSTADYSWLLYFVLLTKAFPFLSRFVAQFNYVLGQLRIENSVSALQRCKDAQAKLNNYHHKYLKAVKLKDFACYRTEYRFVWTLLQIAKSLEKVIVAPGRGYLGAERITTVWERIMQLKANLPPGDELVVL